MQPVRNPTPDIPRPSPVAITPMGAAIAALLDEQSGARQRLAARFAALGAGAVFASWLSDGPRRPVTVRTLRRALGWRRVEALAETAGLPCGEFLLRLTRLLPAAVHRARPTLSAGQEPQQ